MGHFAFETERDEIDKLLTELANNEQLVTIAIDKGQGWILLSAIQLASCHPIKNDLLDMAISTSRRLEVLISNGDKTLEALINDGWRRDNSSVQEQETISLIKQITKDPIEFTFSKIEAWSLMCSIQLAARHPEIISSPTLVAISRDIIMCVIDKIVPDHSVLKTLALSGWDSRFDAGRKKP